MTRHITDEQIAKAPASLADIQRKLVSAQMCHPRAVQSLIAEALDLIDGVARGGIGAAPQGEPEDYKQTHGSKNCMQCAAAYMLGVPLADVPDFEKAGSEAWEAFYAFFADRGFTAEMFPPTVEIDGDYLASGPTERGTSHMVVMRGGKLLHDPHPSNAGLLSVQVVWVIARKADGQQYPLYTAPTPAVPSDERWAIVRETALDVGRGSDARTGGRPELGYAVISNAATFGSEDEAISALRAANLPVGWVVMPVRRLLPDLFTAAPTPPAQPDPPQTTLGPVVEVWGWAIEDKHGVAQAIRPARKEFFGCVQSTEPFTAEDIVKMDREWAGIAPHRIVTLHTRHAEQPKCLTCNGHGLVGGHMHDGSGYGEGCPDCNPEPAAPESADPFLVRDIAEMIGSSVPDVCKALVELGYPQRSTNMEIPRPEAVAVAQRLRPAVPEDVARAGALDHFVDHMNAKLAASAAEKGGA